MKYLKFIICGIFATILFGSASLASTLMTSPTTDDGLSPWTAAVSGTGTSTTKNESSTDFGVQLEVGNHSFKLLTLQDEVGIRQSLQFSTDNGGSNDKLDFNTDLYSDLRLIRLGNIELDGGVNTGMTYGDTDLQWDVAPEVIVRIYLKNDVDLFGRVDYPIDVIRLSSEDKLDYDVGLRVTF